MAQDVSPEPRETTLVPAAGEKPPPPREVVELRRMAWRILLVSAAFAVGKLILAGLGFVGPAWVLRVACAATFVVAVGLWVLSVGARERLGSAARDVSGG